MAASIQDRPAMPAASIPQVRYAGVTYRSLAGQGVLVTGGAMGIGSDIVRAFAGQGCRVGFVDREEVAGRVLAGELSNVFFEPCDVTDVPALQAALGRLGAQVGGVDVLVNNVANDQRHRIEDITPQYFDERIAVNLRPHFFATQAVLGSMRAKGGGSIVNIGSGSWKNKTPNLSVYASAKAAMLGFTRCLARDLGRDGIRVNCIVPGWVMTERQVSLWVDEAGERVMDENHCIPGRIVGADIAHMALFLAADTARMVTAAEFIVDAGWA
jgi:D-xylose 1-dehydrogenase